ncbi:MAG TPA: response regulator transcription factor [Pseudomonadota bacterium]|nr:response regulator transcription factor [Pseudomonadota bacterium]HNF99872.1 response regulator transcription factor [Pseudomonadota bacterium]HNI60293.1 response regulator transcription factor [Pseudomonadota bacterium]HNN50297.1 response regulator transcription factor [Pseudomonadota bacterium]
MNRVLIVEDESAIAESLLFALRRDGFAVTHAKTLQAAEGLLGECDLVVLDLMLPDGSGFDLLAKLRASGQRTPVIILTSRDDEADRVAGLEGGADDYVVKPFSPREVVARIRAVLRRTSAAWAGIPSPLPSTVSGRVLRPPLVIDNDTRRALYQGKHVDLTRTEFELLRVLHSAPERVFTRQQLLDRMFGESYAVTDRTIDAHIKALRRKLSQAGAPFDLVETERGVGYRLREVLSEKELPAR